MKRMIAALMLLTCTLMMSATDIDIFPHGGGSGGVSTGGGGSNGSGHKVPVQNPTASIEDYTLTFDASCIGCMIEVVQDGEVVYTTYVDSCGEVELPSTLSGTLQLFIYRGGITFTGEFEL